MQRHILVAVEEAFGAHQHSNEESNVWRSVTVQLSQLKKSCLSRAMRSKSMTSFSPILCSVSDIHLEKSSDGSMFALSCFLKHLIRFVEHHLSFRATMFWPSTGMLLNDKARDWSKIAIGLLECRKTPRILQFSPATAINHPDFGKSIAIMTLMFCKILAKFEDLLVVHVDE